MERAQGITDRAGDAGGGATSQAESSTYEFRWDVEVPGPERRYGQRFMKQWKRILQAQKMAPLVSAHIPPQWARFQLCVEGDIEERSVAAREAEITAELAHLRWNGAGAPEEHIAGEPAGRHPTGWQGVRVWVAYARQDVEAVLGRKAKI
jgi:hypothetical protein